MNNQVLREMALKAEGLSGEIQAQAETLLKNGKTDRALDLRWPLNLAKLTARDLNERYLALADNGGKVPPSTRAKLASGEYLRQFINALKSGVRPAMVRNGQAEDYRLLLDVLTETGGTPAGSEGGFLTPELFTGLVELQRQYLDLADYVNIAEVLSFKGSRAIESAGPAIALETVTEGSETTEQESPTFTPITYQLVGYGGFMPVSNDLMADTPVNILQYLATWWKKKVALRNNLLIRGLIDALTPTPVADVANLAAAVKTALITTLDPLISAGSVILCNQTGFGLLDALVNTAGQQLLVSDYTLKQHPPVMLPDALWANDTENGTTPILVGNLRELVTLFRRPAYELATDGGKGKSSWRNNNQEVRGIYRCDVQTVDEAAAVLLTVTIPA
jgi:HK97 family phage major capsid protein